MIVSNPPYIPSAVIDGLELLERELWERGTALPELLEELEVRGYRGRATIELVTSYRNEPSLYAKQALQRVRALLPH